MAAPTVTMYTTRFCPYCVAARRLLSAKGVEFEDVAVDGNPELRRRMTERDRKSTRLNSSHYS